MLMHLLPSTEHFQTLLKLLVLGCREGKTHTQKPKPGFGLQTRNPGLAHPNPSGFDPPFQVSMQAFYCAFWKDLEPKLVPKSLKNLNSEKIPHLLGK